MKTSAALINKSCGGHKVETSTQSLPAAVFASLVPLPRALRCSDFDGAVMTDRRLNKVVSRCHRSLFVGAALKDVTYEFFIGCFFLISPSSGRRHKNETPTNTRGAVCVFYFLKWKPAAWFQRKVDGLNRPGVQETQKRKLQQCVCLFH